MARKTKAQIEKEKQKALQNKRIRQWITIVILSAFTILGLIRAGTVGKWLFWLQRYLFGSLFWVTMLLLVLIVYFQITQKRKNRRRALICFLLIALAVMMICTYIDAPGQRTGFSVFQDYVADTKIMFTDDFNDSFGGGLIGCFFYAVISAMFGRPGVIVAAGALMLIAVVLLDSLDIFKNVFSLIVEFFRLPEDEEAEEEEEEEPEIQEEKPKTNFWNLIGHVPKLKLGRITADPPETQPEDNLVIAGGSPAEPDKPEMRKMLNIRADDTTEEIPVVRIPGKVVSSRSSVFINIDDLADRYENYRVPEVPVIEEPVFEEEEPEVFEEEQETVQPVNTEAPAAEQKPKQRRRSNRPYRVPDKYNNGRLMDRMLDPLPPRSANAENEAAAKEKGELLINILRNFGIEAELLETHIGPAVTQFEIRPDANVKISRINSLTDNIKMQLAAKDIRIEAPIPGRNAVGVEIPNIKSTPVKMRELIRDLPEKDKTQPLLFFVGKDLLGKTVTCRLDKMPHLLIAGATGSGKSVCMNSIITSLLLRTDPSDVKMLLVDPKKVEFTPYQNIPHLIGPVINDPQKANNALKVIVRIMDERYMIFSKAGVRNIEVYNRKVKEQNGERNPDGSPAPKKMPYIVVIIDELADLMSVAGKEVEQSIQRITQLARAAGIHLIVATQRPSVDVITGIIKANIPSRIAFAVSSGMDSRTILDHVGAERLLGYGDMLYMPIGQNSATRVQGVFISDDEVKRITDFVSAEAVPMYDDSFVLLEDVENGGEGASSVNDDPLFEEVKEYVIEAQKASTSLLQRRFGIGYNRAARMIDVLEQNGIIGPAQGSKPREVYIKKDE